MRAISGVVVQPGLAIGRARRIAPQKWVISQLKIKRGEVASELDALQAALTTVEAELEQQLNEFTGADEDREILSSHLLILRDPELLPAIREQVSTHLSSAAASVQREFEKVLDHFSVLNDPYFAQRAADFRDVRDRLLGELTGVRTTSLEDWESDQIAVLEEVSPSLVSSFGRHEVQAYCSEHGSYTSHASILTRSTKITAVTGLAGLCDSVKDGETIILDGLEGKVILAPDPATLHFYEQMMERQRL
ncbi:MAG: phosphoenolpyruvate-utilizing N-terminal domain-containing protein, partial [Candidatus Cloacimonadota bacterium]|nr:phosphoenolpyruvate-utilizing N-terminal domain-containing protein [Candidatus Cloacimonadota bacterium]